MCENEFSQILCCDLDSLLGYYPTKCPITCTKEGQFIITICSYHVGDQELIIKLDGELYVSPFSVSVGGGTWFDKLFS